MEKLFQLKKFGTNPRRELVAGLVTFFTMAYIIIVNQSILAKTGIPAGAVIIATCIASAIGTLIMAFVANVPYAQAPGMGLNAFFTYTVVFSLGFSWQQALAMVFICGIINMLITITNIRKYIITAIPKTLQLAIGVGIGFFIFYIGIKDAGLLSFTSDPGTYAALGNGDPAATTIVSNAGAIPAIVAFNTPALLLAVASIFLMFILVVRKVPGAILISIIASTIIGVICGQGTLDVNYFSGLGNSFSELGSVFGQSITAIPTLFADGSKLLIVLATIFAFSLTDTFDTIGTFIGTGRSSGIFTDKEIDSISTSKGFNTRLEKALLADSVATSIGSLFGTSNTTTYVESAAGISAGGRTGLTSVVTGACFILSILLAPLVLAIPSFATAPALIVVGVLMVTPLSEIDWKDHSEAIPALMTALIMTFAYSISTGIAVGFITYCVVKTFCGKAKEIKPVLWIVTALFLANFVISAII